MHFEFFNIPIFDHQQEAKRLNAFLGTHKIIDVEKQFVNLGEQAYWSFCISYVAGAQVQGNQKKEKTDYRNVLNEEDFKRFSTLRKIRKQIAEEEAVPAYAVFTDEELSKLSQTKELTLGFMKTVNGIGSKKIEKYGEKMLELLNKELPE